MNTILSTTILTTACLLGAAACTVELDSDRAAARRLAYRAELTIERDAGKVNASPTRVDVLHAAMRATIEDAVLDDLADGDHLDYRGIDDVNGDGLDDDGRLELVVASALACLRIDGAQVTFDLGRCERT